MNRRPLLAAVVVAVAAGVLSAGCGGDIRDATAPTCSTTGPEALLLVAQSVPTADRIPCITSYPAGWSLGGVEVHNGRTTFTLAAGSPDKAGVKVVLQKACAVTDATEFPTDEPGTTRYDRLPSVDGSRMLRSYTFTGGCVTYDFRLSRRSAMLVDEASLALSFLPRSEIAARVGESR